MVAPVVSVSEFSTMPALSAQLGLTGHAPIFPRSPKFNLQRYFPATSQAGFTLTEILIAIFIFAIGMLMVACIFPAGASFTRRNTDRSVASLVAQNAVAIIKAEYTANDFYGVGSSSLMPIPNMAINLPLEQRAYAFGRNNPYPTSKPAAAAYFWTALLRRTPATTQNKFDLFILVFKKQTADEVFGGAGATPIAPGGAEPGARLPGESNIPMVAQGALAAPQFAIGSEGIGLQSGTVFRKIPAGNGSGVTETTPTLAGEPVAFVPPANGTEASPLVYIYQTTIGF